MKSVYTVLVIAAGLFFCQLNADEISDKAVSEAIREMRGIDPGRMTEEEQETKGEALDKAWDVLSKSGDKGAKALLKEVEAVDKAGEDDAFFKLGAACLIWGIGEVKYADEIAKIWDSTPLYKQYAYVFRTAVHAASLHKPEVVPLLTACLKDKQASYFAYMHSMNITWPLTVEFIWGAYGSKGNAELLKILETSKDPNTLESACILLSSAQYLKALPAIRKLALKGEGSVKTTAVKCLGEFGHPDDFDLLVKGLKTEDAWYYLYALYEYGDQRAVKHIIPFLTSDDEDTRSEAMAALGVLAAPEGIIALMNCTKKASSDKEKEYCRRFYSRYFSEGAVSAEDFLKMTPEKQQKLMNEWRDDRNEFPVDKDSKHLTREDLKKASEDWIKRNRISGGPYEWVYSEHVLEIAKPEDMDLLQDVMASVYLRVSDECLSEIRILKSLIRTIGRRRYRKFTELTPHAQLPGKK